VHVFPQKAVARQAKQAGIRWRIGTSHRPYHWLTCNRLVPLGRKKSPLHEAQLNLRLLKPLGIPVALALGEIPALYGWRPPVQAEQLPASLSPRFNLLFHLKSKGSAKEWRSERFQALAEALPGERFHIYLSGTEEEGRLIREEVPELPELSHVTDLTGRFSLGQLADFIQYCDGVLACSTGPLHLAAAAGVRCLGLYPAERPMHAGRWAPVGAKAEVLSEARPSPGHRYLDQISVAAVRAVLLGWEQSPRGSA
jgi:ADP-heptose:LPS heptosyltransferase